VNFVCGDAMNLRGSFEAGSFDCVVASEVSNTSSTPSDS
jgi:ubiquinone/menaquinone biosynthesis C-methylase UbiE